MKIDRIFSDYRTYNDEQKNASLRRPSTRENSSISTSLVSTFNNRWENIERSSSEGNILDRSSIFQRKSLHENAAQTLSFKFTFQSVFQKSKFDTRLISLIILDSIQSKLIEKKNFGPHFQKEMKRMFRCFQGWVLKFRSKFVSE